MEGIPLWTLIWLRWEQLKDWLRRCPECRARPYSTAAPRWERDRVARMLGIAEYGCPCCGKGAIAERDAGQEE